MADPKPSKEAVELGRTFGHFVRYWGLVEVHSGCDCGLGWPCPKVLAVDAALRAERERTRERTLLEVAPYLDRLQEEERNRRALTESGAPPEEGR